jgi:serine/threonine protein phosphatase 1
MPTIAVGDIHGNLAALSDLLGQLRTELADDDTVVFLGDYIDRGPDTRGCVDAMLAFQAEVRAGVVCLRGNHEDWLLQTLRDHSRHSWLLGMEAFDTIRSYSVEAALALREAVSLAGLPLFLSRQALPYDVFFENVPKAHLEFFENLSPYYRSSDGICVHGGLDPHVADLERQPLEALMWGAKGFPDEYRGGETVAYGHWNNAELNPQGWPMPRIIGSTIGLDTISHGVLTAMRLADRHVFQSARHLVSGTDI